MTVAALPAVITYAEDGVSRSFAAPFRFDLGANLIVERLVAGGVTLLQIGRDYSVTGGQTDAGGTVTLVYPGAAGGRLRIRRYTPRRQPMDYTTGDRFQAESHEAALDRGTMVDQEQEVAIGDLNDRAFLVPPGEVAGTVAKAADRAMRAFVFDEQGRPALAPGSLAQLGADLTSIWYRLALLEFGASVTPFNAAAIATDWSAMQNLARAVRSRAFTNTPIRFAGIGSSNMKNAGGGLAGPQNSPVEVAMRSAKAILDPFGFCQWDVANFGVNGSSYADYTIAGRDDPAGTNPPTPSPQARLLAYKPDVTVVCYLTNDAPPENWNSGQTRDYVPIGVAAIAADAMANDWDVVFLTVPSAVVQRVAPVRINQTIPMGYPRRSWQLGQGSNFDFTCVFTAANNRITSQVGGVFGQAANGFGLQVGKIINVSDRNLGSTIQNAGIYRISAIAGDGTWLQVDRVMVKGTDDFFFSEGPPAALVNEGPVNIAIRRIAIDVDSEQVPSAAAGDKLIAPLGDGRMVRVLTRYHDLNEVQRQVVATLDVPAAQVDIEAIYNVNLIRFGSLQAGEYVGGENRYYAPQERVHWNSVLVSDIMEPSMMAFFRALGPVPKTISNSGAARYLRHLVVRPNAGPSDPWRLIDPGKTRRAVDLMPAAGESVVVRSQSGRIVTELLADEAGGGVARRITDVGGMRIQRPFASIGRNLGGAGSPADMRFVMPGAGLLTGVARGLHPAVADTVYSIGAYWDGESWDFRSTIRNSLGLYPGSNTITFTADNATGRIIFAPIAANSQIEYDLLFQPTVATALATVDA